MQLFPHPQHEWICHFWTFSEWLLEILHKWYSASMFPHVSHAPLGVQCHFQFAILSHHWPISVWVPTPRCAPQRQVDPITPCNTWPLALWELDKGWGFKLILENTSTPMSCLRGMGNFTIISDCFWEKRKSRNCTSCYNEVDFVLGDVAKLCSQRWKWRMAFTVIMVDT